MSKKIVKVETAIASQADPAPEAPKAQATQRTVQNALRAVASRLKAERVQLALLLFDDEILVMAQGRLDQSLVREMTSNVLALTANLA